MCRVDVVARRVSTGTRVDPPACGNDCRSAGSGRSEPLVGNQPLGPSRRNTCLGAAWGFRSDPGLMVDAPTAAARRAEILVADGLVSSLSLRRANCGGFVSHDAAGLGTLVDYGL